MTTEAEKIIIYHGGCFDGFTAAWVANRTPGYWQGAELVAGAYGREPPDVKGKHVLIVDFSYPRRVLGSMYENAGFLRVFDHHESAQKDLEGLDFCSFDMNRSGCSLTWDLLNDNAPRPWLVDAVEDFDLWRHKRPGTREIISFLGSRDQTLEAWDGLMALGETMVVQGGSVIQTYVDRYNANCVAGARFEMLGGFLVPTVNVPYSSASLCADLMRKEYPEAPFTASYYRGKDGKWHFSLRSDDKHESVGDIATRFGGGGHRNAAGFQLETLPW